MKMFPRAALQVLLAAVMTLHLRPYVRGGPAEDRCAAGCRCAADGALRAADCSDLRLTDPPAHISVLTTYLDLSSNDLTSLPMDSFSRLQALRELRLAGNKLNTLHKYAFAGLFHLQVLTLQNNCLSQVPTESLKVLLHLRSLRLDANSLTRVPRGAFRGLGSLLHLWLDDNRLGQVPVAALAGLPSLQALTLAMNHISHLPDRAFHSLGHLVVLHLHNNQISALATRCFEGLHNLETLDMSSNRLESFPIAIGSLPSLQDLNLRNNNIKTIPEYAFIGNPSLETINLHNNPVRSIAKTSFQNLPRLTTLTLSGTGLITRFPNLTGTSSVKSLSITGTHIAELPSRLCGDLPALRQLDLSHNRLLSLPCFTGCRKIQKIDLRHNSIHVIQARTFQKMSGLSWLSAGNALRPRPLPGFRTAVLLSGFGRCALPWSRASRTDPGKRLPAGRPDPEVGRQRAQREEGRPPGARQVPPGLLPEDPRGSRTPWSSRTPWAARVSLWAVFVPSVALNGLVLTLLLFRGAESRAARVQRLLLASLFSLRLLMGLCGTSEALGGEDLHAPPDLPGLEASCWRRWSSGGLALLCSQACAGVLMAAVAWEPRSLRGDRAPAAWGSVRPGAPRWRPAAAVSSIVAAAVVLCCGGATLVLLTAAVWDEVPVRAGGSTRRWGPNAARAALNCGGFLLLSAPHVSSFLRRGGVAMTTHGRPVPCLLLANALASAAEALLWWTVTAGGHSAQCPTAGPWPAGGSPVLLVLALPAVTDPLLYALLHLRHRHGDVGADRPGDGEH